jgi:hypothetical protein
MGGRYATADVASDVGEGVAVGMGDGVGVGMTEGVGCGLNEGASVVVEEALAAGAAPPVSLFRKTRVVVSTPARSTTVAMPTTNDPTHPVAATRALSRAGGSMVVSARNPRRRRSSSTSGTLVTQSHPQGGKCAGKVTPHRPPAALQDCSDLIEREAVPEVECDNGSLPGAQVCDGAAEPRIPSHDGGKVRRL